MLSPNKLGGAYKTNSGSFTQKSNISLTKNYNTTITKNNKDTESLLQEI